MAQEVLVEHAINVIRMEEEPSQLILEAACLKKKDLMQPYINELSNPIKETCGLSQPRGKAG